MREFFDAGLEAGRPFRLELPRRAFLHGLYGERFGSGSGGSLEFQDYREYRPGDDLRRLDWSAYARSDRLTVRLFRNEVQSRVDILCDFSASMLVPSDGGKEKAALYLAGLLAEASFRASASVSLWAFGCDGTTEQRRSGGGGGTGASGKGGWERCFPYSPSLPDFVFPDFGGGWGTPLDGMEKAAGAFSVNSLRIVISDFLWEESPETILRRLGDSAGGLILLAVLSEEEMNPSLSGAVALTDAEDFTRISPPMELVIGPEERTAYLKRLENHLHLWEDAARSRGAFWRLLRLSPDTLPDPAFLADSLILNCD